MFRTICFFGFVRWRKFLKLLSPSHRQHIQPFCMHFYIIGHTLLKHVPWAFPWNSKSSIFTCYDWLTGIWLHWMWITFIASSPQRACCDHSHCSFLLFLFIFNPCCGLIIYCDNVLFVAWMSMNICIIAIMNKDFLIYLCSSRPTFWMFISILAMCLWSNLRARYASCWLTTLSIAGFAAWAGGWIYPKGSFVMLFV